MPAKRTTISRRQHWRISAVAVSIWRHILELKLQPKINARGDLAPENETALRDACVALAAEIGYCKFTIEPARIGDKPWAWITNNSLQMERWELGKQIKDALDRALLEQVAQQRSAAVRTKKNPRAYLSPGGQ